MKLIWMMIGKTDFDFVEQGVNEYVKRLKKYISLEIIVLADVKMGSKVNPDVLKEKEADLLLAKIKDSDNVVLLDEKGKQFSSVGFAGWINEQLNYSSSNLVFVIGGAYGFSDRVYQRAKSKISLSSLTFSHQLVRLLFAEQLYRAFTIIRGESYHHE